MAIKSIAYTYMIGDLFHYGHLNLLQQARKKSDYHITGVISDEIAEAWQSVNISKYEERRSVIENIVLVDEVLKQDSMDPTINLKEIHNKYPDAKIILFQGHQEWGQMPGVNYINSINGEIIRPDYYPNLSREKIIISFNNYITKNKIETKTIGQPLLLGDLNCFTREISTKGETLKHFSPILKKSRIEKLFIFTVKQWESNQKDIINSIKNQFSDQKVIVRSSALIEDSMKSSYAGAFKSVLDVPSNKNKLLTDSISSVVESYGSKADKKKQDQILVQHQTESIKVSGVIFTRNLEANTPYYMINYDDEYGKTDLVTSGAGGKRVEILRTQDSQILSEWMNLIEAVKEIETLLSGIALDIEFGINKNNEVIIFQIRPLAANLKIRQNSDSEIYRIIEDMEFDLDQKRKEMGSLKNIFSYSDMAFWNPSELIGDRPNYLDYSLFNYLIMKSNWNKALVPLGYTPVDKELMVLLAGKPYINLPYSFISLLPDKLSPKLKDRLIRHYYNKLESKPELHDKIEFDIVHNCYDFSIDLYMNELKDDAFTEEETEELRNELLKLTNKIIINSRRIFSDDESSLRLLTNNRKQLRVSLSKDYDFKTAVGLAKKLIDDVNKYGIIQFSRVARMAFIGRRIIASSEKSQLIDSDLINDFWSSFPTVVNEIKNDLNKLINDELNLDEFLSNYGHLRPGTYDITSLPYSKFPEYILNGSKNKNKSMNDVNDSNNNLDLLVEHLDKICSENDLAVNGKELLNFARETTQLRELFKFEYTKNISVALELIACAGKSLGYSRSDISNLDIDTIFIPIHNPSCSLEEIKNIWDCVIKKRKEEKEYQNKITLPSIIFSNQDLRFVKHFTTKPNYITNKTILGDIVNLSEISPNKLPDISNKIVMIKNADPGYDWIFTRDIIGLITMYGGAASHMAIRCAELQLPAAIGCGELLYNTFNNRDRIQLDCKNKKIIALS